MAEITLVEAINQALRIAREGDGLRVWYAIADVGFFVDRGGAIKGNKLDVYFHSHTEALKWGRQKLTVTVVERRPVLVVPGYPTPYEAELRAIAAGLALIAPPPEPPPEVMPRTITLTERAALIRAALRDAPAIVLQDLLHGVRDRVVVAVTFLALLELFKQGLVDLDQRCARVRAIMRTGALEPDRLAVGCGGHAVRLVEGVRIVRPCRAGRSRRAPAPRRSRARARVPAGRPS